MAKNFFKAADHNGNIFQYVQQKFPQISESKIEEGIFVGPKIKDLMKNKNLDALLKGTKKTA